MTLYEVDRNKGESISEDFLMFVLDKHVVPTYQDFYGLEYNVSVTLSDGTFLPCVAFRHAGKAIQFEYDSLHKVIFSGITSRRQMSQDEVNKIVLRRLLHQNTISLSDISKIEKCLYSMPDRFRKKLEFHPTHYFLAEFNDGNCENFRGSEDGFYEVPCNKNLEDIIEIFGSEMILQNGQIIKLKNYSDWMKHQDDFKKIHVGKPYFVCYFGDEDEDGFEKKNQKARINFRE
ncbi:hypothetical protein [Chryseobacterium caseinilyticum]|uniref:Uncharacterized protein n=1 Tax=Chryseobacterium caseinilyticum TaxID=2771428 RepID=A0ABR8ZED6_9FLAO|nr:hypothetical protein [Chryseobacterium caseinilyticum]MBD8083659.1 hypothetical protein [Chryseobacterium caseinilyticum]